MPKFITTELTKAAALSLSCRAPSSVRGGTGLIRGYRERKGHGSKRGKLEEDPRESWGRQNGRQCLEPAQRHLHLLIRLLLLLSQFTLSPCTEHCSPLDSPREPSHLVSQRDFYENFKAVLSIRAQKYQQS